MKKQNILSTFLIISLLLYHDTLAFGLINNENIIKLGLFAVIAFIFFYFVAIKRNIQIQRKSLFLLVVLIIALLFNMLVNQDYTFGYVYLIILLTLGFFVNHLIDSDEYIEVTIKCMYFLAIYSILIYLFRSFVFSYRSFFPHFYNDSGLPFFHLGASVLVDNPSYYRLFGIFRESGVYQIFLNIAVMFELFARKGEIRKKYIIVFIITIVLTFSTPGYFALFSILLIYMVMNLKKASRINKKNIRKIISVFFIIAIIYAIVNPSIIYYFDSAISKFTNKESSYIGRTTSIIVELRLWTNRPFFGYGITKGFELSKSIGSQILNLNMFNTSTFTGLLVTLGGVFTSMFTLMFVKAASRLNGNVLTKTFLVLVLVFIMSSQLMMYNPYIYSLLFWGLNYKNKVYILAKQDNTTN